MAVYNEEQLQIEKDSLRKHLLKYTRKAFRMLPQLNKPRILDMGYGSGVPTLELARLSKGEITGIDIDQRSLYRLNIDLLEESEYRILPDGTDEDASIL